MNEIQEEDIQLIETDREPFLEGIRSLDASLGTLGAPIVNESKKERVATRTIEIHRYAWLGDTRGIFIRYNHGIWVENIEKPLEFLISQYLVMIGMPTSTQNIESVKDKMKRQRQLKHLDFDKEPFYVNFKNGLLDTRTWEFGPHPEEFYSFNQIPHNYVPDARCPKFTIFLVDWLSDNEEEIERWWEWNGYCLQPSKKLKKEALYIGPTDSGKTTCSKIQIAVIGEENHSEVSFQNLCSEKSFQKAPIIHKLFNYDDDLSKIAIMAMNEFKKITGHNKIPFEKKFQDPSHARNITKHQFCGNALPIVEDIDPAFANRWIIFHFLKTYAKEAQDLNLAERITSDENEIEGIIAESIKGLKRVFARNYFRGMQKEEVLHLWKMKSDEVYKFVHECCYSGDSIFISTDSMFDAFIKWSEISGEETTVHSKNAMTNRLRKFSYQCIVKKNETGKAERYYYGIALKPDFEDLARDGFTTLAKDLDDLLIENNEDS